VQTIDLAGVGLRGSAPPTDVLSLVSAVELQLQSPNTRPPALIEGEQDLYDHADLKYVGVTSDLPAVPTHKLSDSTLFFGLATYAPWSTPSEVAFNIYIDVDRDKTNDYRLYNSDSIGYANASVRTDAFVSVVENLHTGLKTIQGPLNAVAADRNDSGLLFGSVMVLPAHASALGLNGTTGAFSYYVETSSGDISETKDTTVDRTPVLRFDAASPTLDLTGGAFSGVLREDQPGLAIPVRLSVPAYAAAPAAGVLLLHHNNRAGEQAEVVDVHFQWPYQVNMPVIGR
jgi:hypothetical protein